MTDLQHQGSKVLTFVLLGKKMQDELKLHVNNEQVAQKHITLLKLQSSRHWFELLIASGATNGSCDRAIIQSFCDARVIIMSRKVGVGLESPGTKHGMSWSTPAPYE